MREYVRYNALILAAQTELEERMVCTPPTPRPIPASLFALLVCVLECFAGI